MRFLRGFHPESELRAVIEEVRGLASRTSSAKLEKLIMGLTAEVQALVDKVAANTDIVKSAEQALTALEGQIGALQAQLGAIQPGQSISAEDLAALQKAASDLGETNAGLQAAIPANTAPVTSPPDSAPPSTPPSA